MKDFKLEIFNRNFPGIEFPLEKVSHKSCEALIDRIMAAMPIDDQTRYSPPLFFQIVLKNATREIQVSSTEENLFFETIEQDFFIKKSEIVHVIWETDEIDLMRFEDLKNYWDDLWYSTGDEAVIFYFESANFLIFVDERVPLQVNYLKIV